MRVPASMLGRAVALALCVPALVARAEVPDTRQAELLHLLAHDCGSCHGMRLTGGLGPPLTSEALADRSVESLRAIILNGRPAAGMPPWRPFLTEEEADWLAETMKRGSGRAPAAH